MREPCDLAAALADPASVPIDQIPSVIGELEKTKALLWAWLAAPVPAASANGRSDRDVVHDVGEVARIVRRSVSWVRKRGHSLPGFHQPGGRGTRVGWSRRALEAWATGGTREGLPMRGVHGVQSSP